MRTMVWSMVLFALCASPSVAASRITDIAWGPGTGAGERRLQLRIRPPVSDVAVAVSDGTLQLRVPGSVLEAATPDGVKVTTDKDGVIVTVPAGDGSLRSVSLAGGALTAVLQEPDRSATYKIGVGDVLYVAVYKNADLTAEYTVSPEGTIKLPLVGEVPAAGSTERELTRRLTRILAKDYLVDPQVAVTVRTYQSQFVYVTGAVAQSHRVALRPGMTLQGILADAGVALAPGQELTLRRAGPAAGPPERLGAKDLDSPDAPEPKNGDVVTVLERAYVYLEGEFRQGGRIPLQPKMTLLQAISVVGGLTEWANRSDVRIRRTIGDEVRDIRVNLKRVEEHKDPDPELHPDDLVLVRRRVL